MESIIKAALSKTLGPLLSSSLKDSVKINMRLGIARITDTEVKAQKTQAPTQAHGRTKYVRAAKPTTYVRARACFVFVCLSVSHSRKPEVNCEAINAKIRATADAPFEFRRVYISSLTVRASMKYTKKPILIEIDEVVVDLVEPTKLQGPPREAAPARKPRRAKRYGTSDRVTDGLTVTIKSLRVIVETRGLYKTPSRGPWTPPVLKIHLQGLRVCSTDGDWIEQDFAALWKANRKKDEFMVYKKISLGQLTITCVEPSGTYPPSSDGHQHSPIEHIILDEHAMFEVLSTTKKRSRDSLTLDIKNQVVVPRLDLCLDVNGGSDHATGGSLPALVHTIFGIIQCLNRG